MITNGENILSQASPEVINLLQQIAESEGRQLQTVLDEALREYIERKAKSQTRLHVIEAFSESVGEFDTLYRELAK
jgi:predicted transcriptional regulator